MGNTGWYTVWRSEGKHDCVRIGPGAKCFCGHLFENHAEASRKNDKRRCLQCGCRKFSFIPQRPEEVGEWWLPRRKGFNVHKWRAKCKCGHTHEEHGENRPHCCKRCGCGSFNGAFACLVCNRKWADHETLTETPQERQNSGRAVGA